MARKVTLVYQHAVYDTFSYQRGADLDVDKRWLGNLLRAADATFVRSKLDTSGEFFFDSTDTKLVFGFERERSEALRDDMAFFDLFTMPLEQAREIPLHRLPEILKRYLVDEYAEEPSPPKRQIAVKVSDNGSIRWDESGNPVRESVDAPLIADMWEQYRRNSVQLEASLADVSEFVNAVDGLFEAVSFASAKRANTSYFDIVGRAYEPRFEPRELTRTVEALAARGRLERELLPTYADELRAKRRRNRAAIRNDDTLSNAISDAFDVIAEQTTDRAEELPKRAASLMEQADEERLVKADKDEGIRSRVSGLINRSDDDPKVLDSYDYDGVKTEVVEIIDAELDDQRRELKRQLDERLLDNLHKALNRRIDKQTADLAEETIERLAATNTSKAYEETDPEKR